MVMVRTLRQQLLAELGQGFAVAPARLVTCRIPCMLAPCGVGDPEHSVRRDGPALLRSQTGQALLLVLGHKRPQLFQRHARGTSNASVYGKWTAAPATMLGSEASRRLSQ